MLQPQVVATKDVVYAGGGLAKMSMQKIFAYSTINDTWTTLPETSVILFAMCAFKGALVTVGGGCETGLTGKVYDLNEREKIWNTSFPVMPTERLSLSLFTTDSVMVACGGAEWEVGNTAPEPCTTVEVYQSTSNSWFRVRDLPRPCAAMSSTFIDSMCYLIGNVNPRNESGPICADIQDILKPNDSSVQSDWKHLQVPPIVNSSIVGTKSYLLLIGGYTDMNGSEKSIHIYTLKNKCWWRLAGGDLPHEVESSAVVMLDSGELMVIGGENRNGEYSDEVFIGNSL